MTGLQRRAFIVDQWDEREFAQASKGVRRFARARRGLRDVSPTAGSALEDMFFALTKADPRLVSPSEIDGDHLLNRLVAAAMLDLPTIRRLRTYTVGDPTQALLSCTDLAPTVEVLFERLALEQERAKQLAEELRALGVLAGELAEVEAEFDAALGDDPDDAQLDALLARADELRERRRELEDRLQQADEQRQVLDDAATAAVQAANDAVGDVADQVGDGVFAAQAWGVAPGELRRLPAKARLALARRLKGARMREVADLFGRMRNLWTGPPSLAPTGAPHEVVDIRLGGDLALALPSELLLLAHPDTEPDFLARWSDRELLQYETRGDDDLGRGGIVLCVDESGSMSGAPELWAKALMLVLLHEARDQRRTMHVVHFSGPGQFMKSSFEAATDFTAERIIEAAETYFGGGTDFETPLSVALDVLRTEFDASGRTQADVVFVTDGQCSVSPPFLDHYLAEMRRMSARTFGLEVTGYPSGSLDSFCEGKVMSVQDLRSGADLKPLMGSLR